MIREEIVVLIRRDKLYKPFRLRKGRKVTYDRLSFYPDGALGHPYGSCFEVHGHQLVRSGQQMECKEHASGVDNRGIFDDSSSQKLTEQDISEMREQGVSGQEIVESMIEHSATFKEKTRYSQQKYINKKKKKHVPVLTIIKPSTKMLCEMYYARGPSKICHLRVDTLAQIVTYSNAHAHSSLLLLETCQGLLAGALLERMGGLGNLVQVFFGDFPVRLALENFSHLSDGDQSILLEYPLHRVGPLLHPQQATPSMDTCSEEPHRDVGSRPSPEPHGEGVSEPGTEPCGDTVGVELGLGDSGDGAQSSTVTVEPDTELHGDSARDENHPKSSMELRGDTEPDGGTESMDLDSRDGETPGGHSSTNPSPEIADPRELADEQPAPGSDPDSEPSGRGHLAKRSKVQEEDSGARSAAGKEDERDTEWGRAWRGRRPKRKWQQSEDGTLKREKRKREKEERFRLAEEVLRQKQMDGLIIASRFHPEPVLMTLIDFVAPSRPVVVYCHIIEPLVQCYHSLKDAGVAFNIQISETWLRHYQMLPERTHPEMKMDARSGYLLTATTVKRTN